MFWRDKRFVSIKISCNYLVTFLNHFTIQSNNFLFTHFIEDSHIQSVIGIRYILSEIYSLKVCPVYQGYIIPKIFIPVKLSFSRGIFEKVFNTEIYIIYCSRSIKYRKKCIDRDTVQFCIVGIYQVTITCKVIRFWNQTRNIKKSTFSLIIKWSKGFCRSTHWNLGIYIRYCTSCYITTFSTYRLQYGLKKSQWTCKLTSYKFVLTIL